MEAKDTELGINELITLYNKHRGWPSIEEGLLLDKNGEVVPDHLVPHYKIAKAQAEISFEAGIERGWEQAEAHYYIDTG